jgi:hypothetical protein
LSNRVIQLSLSLLVGILIGGVAGRMTAPITTTPTAVKEQPAKPKQDIRSVAKMVKKAEEAIEASDGGGLGVVGDILNAASVSDLLDWGSAPERVSSRIINEMSDDELISTITSITKIDSDALAEVSDLRDYANRLTHIAMSGIITPEISDEFADVDVSVEFATDASSSGGAEDPRFVFDQNARKIYAVIPNAGIGAENVMVHWYRVDQPENLLFDQYRVSPDDDYSYVWLKAPNREWQPGTYRVEFFSSDELVTPLASGTYSVPEQ